MSSRLIGRAAARNNAEWCDTFCRTHGIADCFPLILGSVRFAHRLQPRCGHASPGTTADEVLTGIDTGDGCSVEDSFAVLDLAAVGFRPLFRAVWLVREPAQTHSVSARRWSAVTSEEQLGEWEAAWGERPEGPGLFRRALLEDETISVLAGYNADRSSREP